MQQELHEKIDLGLLAPLLHICAYYYALVHHYQISKTVKFCQKIRKQLKKRFLTFTVDSGY